MLGEGGQGYQFPHMMTSCQAGGALCYVAPHLGYAVGWTMQTGLRERRDGDGGSFSCTRAYLALSREGNRKLAIRREQSQSSGACSDPEILNA